SRAREMLQSSSILQGRQIVWMVLDYFKFNRTLQEQYKYQDIESLKWRGDEKFGTFLQYMEANHHWYGCALG
ncbi:MAG: hypothetical protein ACKPKO_59905, partial [Candidatus Fonsibacter sp.]